MSPPGRPERRYRRARHERAPVWPPGPPGGDAGGAAQGGVPASPVQPCADPQAASPAGVLRGRGTPAAARPAVLLSYLHDEAESARRLAAALASAGLEVVHDPWDSQGLDAPRAVLRTDPAGHVALLPVLGARPLGPLWEARRLTPAQTAGVPLLPVRAAGDPRHTPDALRPWSQADLRADIEGEELARLLRTLRERTGAALQLPEPGRAPPAEPPGPPILLEAGPALAPLLLGEGDDSSFLDEALPALVDGLWYELGVVFPMPQLHADPALPPRAVRLRLHGVPMWELALPSDEVLVAEQAATLRSRGIPARPQANPASGAASAWVPAARLAQATRGGTVHWTPVEVLQLQLVATLRRKAADFLGVLETRALLDQVAEARPHLVAEVVPGTVPLLTLAEVLRRLLAEEVGIRNLRPVLTAVALSGRFTDDPALLAEAARTALQRQITHRHGRGTGTVVVLLLHPEIEALLADGLRHSPTATWLELAEAERRRLLARVQEVMQAVPPDGQRPALLVPQTLRAALHRLLAPVFPHLGVLCYEDIEARALIQPVGRIEPQGVVLNPRVHWVGAGQTGWTPGPAAPTD